MYRARSKARRWQIVAVAGAAVTLVGVGLGVASAAENGPGTVSCPGVAIALPAVPAESKAEVDRNLALLNTQIAEANKRLVDTEGQGGANFVDNAILGPLKDKRASTIDRIVISIGRHAAKPSLNVQALATCKLNTGGGASAAEPADVPVAAAPDAAAVGTVNCPDVAGTLPAVPAQAKAEVDRNLALLNTQIAEANKRLIDTVGQGGAAFIDNAILGPLEDKRFATINRIETAIGRNAAKPDLNAEGLAPCTLNAAGGGGATAEPTAAPTAAPVTTAPAAGGAVAAGTVNCPALMNLPAIPAQAKAEVDRNLALLDTQIAEANQRLIDTVGQGGGNFINNAILGPLKDKRFATINRIETAIGRNAAKPDLNAEGLAACTLNS